MNGRKAKMLRRLAEQNHEGKPDEPEYLIGKQHKKQYYARNSFGQRLRDSFGKFMLFDALVGTIKCNGCRALYKKLKRWYKAGTLDLEGNL